jgi:DNA ligase (NAD+)
VIPKFLSVVQSASGSVSIPTQCPSCQSELFFDGIRLTCLANFTCPAQLSGAILNWIKAVNIEDLSEKRLQQLIDGGLVKGIPDLYQLTEADLLKLPATRETMAKKLIKNIEVTKTPELVDFLNGLGIPGMGVNSWNDLCKVAPNLQSICTLKIEDIEAIDGFANKTAVGIVKGLIDRADLIQNLLKTGVKPKESTLQVKGSKLFGLTFVITGALSRPRSEIEKIIIDQGGKVVGSVSKNTNILLTNDQDVNSTKAKKAKELGIDIWNETNLDSYIS